MTDFVQLSGNPTVQQAALLRLGIAASQTAYSLNNGGGLSIGLSRS